MLGTIIYAVIERNYLFIILCCYIYKPCYAVVAIVDVRQPNKTHFVHGHKWNDPTTMYFQQICCLFQE